jgi:replicative DNA helicase
MIDIEHAVIVTVIDSEDYAEVLAQGIKPDFFTDQQHRRVFQLINEHLIEHRKVPGKEAVLRAFPNYSFGSYADYPEPVGYYAKELRDRHLYRNAMSGIKDRLLPLLSDENARGRDIHDAIGQVYFDVGLDAPSGTRSDLFATAEGYAIDAFARRERDGYLRGISTGFDSIDRATGGFQPQQLITFVGLPKHGKSTMMLAEAVAARRQGYRVLFVTFEMSNEEQIDRAISLITGYSLTRIMEGNLRHNEKQEIFRILRQHKTLEGLTLVHDRNSMLTLNGVNQVVLEERPDIVFVDGMYLMDDEKGEPPMSPRAITNLTRGFKRLGQSHKIPFVVSTQALLSRSRGGLNVGSIGYSSSFLQDSDIVIGVDKKTRTVSEFKAMAVRAGVNFTAYVRIDWNQGLIEEIDPALALLEIEHRASGGPGGNWSGSSSNP